MVKTIQIDENTSLTLSNSLGWMRKYKTQFGRDIVPTLLPMVNALTELLVEIMRETNGSVKDAKDIIMALDGDTVRDAMLELAGFEIGDLVNITWAMAKQANPDTPTPEEWEDSLECFPLDVMGPALLELIIGCFVTTKNSKRVQEAMKNLNPSN